MEGIESIVKQLTEHFQNTNIKVSKTLASFILKSIIQDNPHLFKLDEPFNEEQIKTLSDMAIKTLSQKNQPNLETIKMQVSFDESSINNEDKLAKKKIDKLDRLKNIEGEILNCHPKNLNDFDALVLLYRQIYNYLLIDWDGIKNRNIEREIAASMESVLPRTGLKVFVSLSPSDKLSQLSQLANIVLGIRLYNKSIGKGGSGINNVREILLSEIEDIKNNIIVESLDIKNLCNKYQDCISYLISHNDTKNLERLIDESNNRRQYSSYLEFVENDICELFDRVMNTSNEYLNVLMSLKDFIGSKSSVPKDVAYPKFEQLAKHYKELEIQRDQLQSFADTLTTLREYKDTFTCTLPSDLIKKSSQIINEINLPSPPPPPLSKPLDETPHKLTLQTTPELMNLPLEFDGYCVYTIVEYNSCTIHGNPKFGVVRYKNSFYIFSSDNALNNFMINPEYYINKALEIVKSKSELVRLLKLDSQFPDISIPNLIGKGPESQKVQVGMKDASTETPVHFIERYIDHSYEWNEWNLRRKTLQMIRLTKSRTIAVQTEKSHFKASHDTQVFPKYEFGTQTTRDNGTNPIINKNYLFGLKGDPNMVAETIKFQHEMKT